MPADRAPGARLGVLGRHEIVTAVAIVIGATALRLIVALCSRGTNDIDSWERFANQVHGHGVLWMYEHVPAWNHPPLMGYLVAGLHTVASSLGWRFAPAFKLVPIAADVLTQLLIFTVWQRRTGDSRLALAALVIFALSLDAVLVSGYHGNTDSLVGALVLAACVAAERQRYVWAGILLGAAVNVKLIPLLLVPLLLARATPREMARFAAGAALGVIPFLPVLWSGGRAFFDHAVAYRSNFDNWGMPLLIRTPRYVARELGLGALTDATERARDAYVALGPYVIAGAVLAVTAFTRWVKPLSIYERAAVGLSLFLVLTPGFGVQYTAILGPVLLAASLTWGLWWALLSGLFIGAVYAAFWTGGWPLHSQFTGTFPVPAAAVGVAAWALLVVFTVATLRRRPPVP
jgi:hypothetical protein